MCPGEDSDVWDVLLTFLSDFLTGQVVVLGRLGKQPHALAQVKKLHLL